MPTPAPTPTSPASPFRVLAFLFRALASPFRTAAFFLIAFGCGLAPAVPRADASGEALEAAFREPPEAARPWVFWYWMKASSSRAGITADLEAMKEAGIGGAHLVPIQGAAKPPLFEPPVEQFTEAWWDHVLFAFKEADRLGLKIGMHGSDGYATAGGPWITPELSMQKVVWTATQVEGGRRVGLALPQPEASQGCYRDIITVAYPAPPGAGVSSRTARPRVTTSLAGADAQTLAEGGVAIFTSGEACWIQYEFERPFTCRALTVRIPRTKGIQNATYHANHLAVEVSDDGRRFRKLAQLEPPRHGWQDGDADVTHAIPETAAKFFRFVFDPENAAPGGEDLDSAKWKPALKLTGIDLLAESRLHHYESKTGEVWRVSPPTPANLVPAGGCVPLAKCVDLTGRTGADGRLEWDAPAGSWTVLRIGHTSTGARNDTAGAVIGLECDKFNPAAARLMFDRWFGEIIRRAGPGLAGRVLKVFHIDSWECGSQNWSPVFRGEFQRRRGYDPLPWLPAMAGVPLESADVSERFLRDVRETIGELVRDNFYAPLHELAQAHGCAFSGECTAPVMAGDGMSVFGALDTPMGEFWLRSPTHDKLNDMLDAISGARVYGKPVVQAEAFTELWLAWDETPASVKALGDFNYALGANRFVYHVFTHNPWTGRRPGMAMGHVGLYFQRDQTWWRPGRAWVDYARRCQALLQQGAPVADIAVFTGDAAPRRAVAPWRLAPTLPGFFPAGDARLAKKIIESSDWADPLRGYAYDSINRDALLRLGRVRGGRLELPGGAAYAILIVPASHPLAPAASALTPEITRRLREIAEAGVTVILGERPARSASLGGFPESDAEVARDAGILWPEAAAPGAGARPLGRGRVAAGPFPGDSFAALQLAPDFTATAADGARADGIAWTHRAGAGWDLYFVSNQRDTERVLELSLRAAGRVPELWDPVGRETRAAGTWAVRDGRTVLPVRLPSGGSLFVILRKPGEPPARPASPNWHEPAAVQPLSGKWTVTFDPASGGPRAPRVFDRLQSWTEFPDDGVRHYSGTAVYAAAFEWDASAHPGGRVWLDLGRVAELAEVSLNGAPCGIAWTPPYRVEVTPALRAGTNELRIEITNTWFNRLAGDRDKPESERLARTTAPDATKGRPLLDAGLLGPVTLCVGPPAEK
ncbi:MAG: hypothetical protein LBC18_11530 [Opitutaceae bacterium]|jgi:hypothetical protein|nr:hypothetical protein [Opitutaceae bacterium]